MESIVVEFMPAVKANAVRGHRLDDKLGPFRQGSFAHNLKCELQRILDDLGHLADVQDNLGHALCLRVLGSGVDGIENARHDSHLVHDDLLKTKGCPKQPFPIAQSRDYDCS